MVGWRDREMGVVMAQCHLSDVLSVIGGCFGGCYKYGSVVENTVHLHLLKHSFKELEYFYFMFLYSLFFQLFDFDLSLCRFKSLTMYYIDQTT